MSMCTCVYMACGPCCRAGPDTVLVPLAVLSSPRLGSPGRGVRVCSPLLGIWWEAVACAVVKEPTVDQHLGTKWGEGNPGAWWAGEHGSE